MNSVYVSVEYENGRTKVAFSDKPELMLQDEYQENIANCVIGALAETAKRLTRSREDAMTMIDGIAEQAKQAV